jgi:hypothetical protein
MFGILLKSAGLFALSVLVHVVAWRAWRPRTYRAWLPSLTGIFVVLAGVIAWLASTSLTELAAILLFQWSLSVVYIIGYTLLTAFSPSIEILKLIDRSPGGLTLAEMDLPFLANALSGDRIGNLGGAGLVEESHGMLRLGSKGRLIVGPVQLFRHAIGLRDGGGG